MRPSAISSLQMEFLSILCSLIRVMTHKMTTFKGSERYFTVLEICQIH